MILTSLTYVPYSPCEIVKPDNMHQFTRALRKAEKGVRGAIHKTKVYSTFQRPEQRVRHIHAKSRYVCIFVSMYVCMYVCK